MKPKSAKSFKSVWKQRTLRTHYVEITHEDGKVEMIQLGLNKAIKLGLIKE